MIAIVLFAGFVFMAFDIIIVRDHINYSLKYYIPKIVMVGHENDIASLRFPTIDSLEIDNRQLLYRICAIYDIEVQHSSELDKFILLYKRKEDLGYINNWKYPQRLTSIPFKIYASHNTQQFDMESKPR